MNDTFQTLTFVDSSNIIGISYDRDNFDMYVLFKGNKIYKYVEVHNMMWDRFKLSPSKGKFLAESIKNHYEAELYSEIEAYSIIGYLGDKIVVTSVDMTRGFIVYEGSKRLIVDGAIEELPVDVGVKEGNKYRIEFEDVNKHFIPQGLSLPHWLELVERATPKKIPFNHWGLCDCGYEPDLGMNFCPSCGQALDWNDSNENS